ncbi:MAG: ABC transporter permease, partial [Pseudomonadota bacterium]|nr:ABC transporter permease [Pseudomonadota bacterium]
MSNASTKARSGFPNPLQWLGSATLGMLSEVGRLSIFTGKTIGASFSPRWYLSQIFRQMVAIGFYSLPVVGLSAIF